MIFLNSRQIMDVFFDFTVVLIACAVSQFLGWYLRRTRSAHRLDIGSSEEAYLIGGEKRVVEVAFFKLVRDGWINNDGDGRFSVRLEGDAQVLPPVEYEMLQLLAGRGDLPLAKICELRPKSLEPIRAQLVSKNLWLSAEDRKLVYFSMKIPLWFAIGFCLFSVEENWIQGAKGELAGCLALAGGFLAYILNGNVGFHTLAGEDQYLSLLKAFAERSGQAGGRSSKNYDRLWQMKDQVLFGGIAALNGTVFASLPASSKKAPKPKEFKDFENSQIGISAGALHTASERVRK